MTIKQMPYSLNVQAQFANDYEPAMDRDVLISQTILMDEPPEILSWDDIVSSEEESAQFLAKISDYCSPVPMPADINMRFLVAYELLAEAKTILGTREIRHWCDMSDRFDKEIVA